MFSASVLCVSPYLSVSLSVCLTVQRFSDILCFTISVFLSVCLHMHNFIWRLHVAVLSIFMCPKSYPPPPPLPSNMSSFGPRHVQVCCHRVDQGLDGQVFFDNRRWTPQLWTWTWREITSTVYTIRRCRWTLLSYNSKMPVSLGQHYRKMPVSLGQHYRKMPVSLGQH